MKVLDPGHLYNLTWLDDKSFEGVGAVLRFVKREGPMYPGNVGSYPGTNLQEVLRACLDRMEYLNRQEYSVQNDYVIDNLTDAIWHLEERAALRHGRPRPSQKEAVQGPTCSKCGHVGCQGECH